MGELVAKGAFMGWEKPNSFGISSIAPGLGLAAPKGLSLYKEILDGFENLRFYKENGERNSYSMIPMVTDLLIQKGLKKDGSLQTVNNIILYPDEYFCPMDAVTGKVDITSDTYTIHWYTMSWLPKTRQWRVRIMRFLRSI